MTQAAPSNPRQITPHHALLAATGPQPSTTHYQVLDTHIIPSTDPTPLDTLQSILDQSPSQPTSQTTDNHWLITLSYNLAPTIEPSIPLSPNPFPHIIAQRIEPTPNPSTSTPTQQAPWSVDPTKLSITNKADYQRIVSRALEYIAAGDIYQVNLTHPITLPFAGSSHTLAQQLFQSTSPTQGSYTVFDTDNNTPNTRHAIISLSPETFLTYNPTTNTLTTEPMKGTSPAASNPADLYHSPKDRAELNMIIDLMRNDLARISTPGSVRVTNPRQITTHHNSVHQATATIESTRRPNTTLSQILKATFPPGSITGAPKVRAMQIIQELESTLPNHQPRSPYCGSTIALSPNGAFNASVNIRTLHIQGTPSPSAPDAFENATLTYFTGAGIVADSSPQAEWEETLTKADILQSTLGISLPKDLSPNP